MEPPDFAGKAPPPSAELERATSGGGRVRTRRPGRALAAVLALSLAYGALLLLALFHGKLRADLSAQPLAFTVGVGGVWALGFVGPLSLALLPARGQVLPRVAAARWAAVAASLALVALSLLLARAVPGASAAAADPAQLASATLRCFAVALVVAVAPLAAGLIALRRALPVGARGVGAALGAGGGALGGLFLHVHCAWAEPLHVAFGHGGAVAAGAIAGALLAPLVMDP